MGRLEKYRGYTGLLKPKNPSQRSRVQKRNIIMLSGAAVNPRVSRGVLFIASCASF